MLNCQRLLLTTKKHRNITAPRPVRAMIDRLDELRAAAARQARRSRDDRPLRSPEPSPPPTPQWHGWGWLGMAGDGWGWLGESRFPRVMAIYWSYLVISMGLYIL